MKIFLDFDGVIFNTELFKKRLAAIFPRNGVSQKDFKASYRRIKKKELSYSPFNHIKYLANNKEIDSKKISSDLRKLLINLKPFVFDEAKKFLKRFSKNDLYLISYGDLDFQRKKIRNSQISNFFKRIVITDADKGKIIKNIAKKDKFKKEEAVIFIDDKAKHIKEARQRNVITFQITRPGQQRLRAADFNARNLKAVEKFIKNITIKS
jgi:FMN phosphatase YigB (HAD superfamily)